MYLNVWNPFSVVDSEVTAKISLNDAALSSCVALHKYLEGFHSARLPLRRIVTREPTLCEAAF